MNPSRSGKIILEIRKAVHEGRLLQPFRAADVRRAIPDFGERTYNVFLPKHREGNPDCETELFIRVKRGLYKLR